MIIFVSEALKEVGRDLRGWDKYFLNLNYDLYTFNVLQSFNFYKHDNLIKNVKKKASENCEFFYSFTAYKQHVKFDNVCEI